MDDVAHTMFTMTLYFLCVSRKLELLRIGLMETRSKMRTSCPNLYTFVGEPSDFDCSIYLPTLRQCLRLCCKDAKPYINHSVCISVCLLVCMSISETLTLAILWDWYVPQYTAIHKISCPYNFLIFYINKQK